MPTTESVNSFISDYEQICRKHNLYIDVTATNKLGIYQLDKDANEYDFNVTLADWREENGR